MSDRETRFEAHTAKRHLRTLGLVSLVLMIGYLRDIHEGASFPRGTTLLFAAAVFFSFEFHAALRGARSLSISPGGITLERSFGGRVLRLSWHEIKRVEVRRSFVGLTWTFYPKEGRGIRWEQSDFDGDQRLELEKALRIALQQHGLRIE